MYGNYYAPFMGASPDNFSTMRPQYGQQTPQYTPPTQQSNGGLVWVQGEAGAKSYLVAPGTTIMLMDSESNVFYLKSSDASGMPLPLRIFDYTERNTNAPQTPNNAPQDARDFDPGKYITRDEFEERISEIAPKNASKKTKGDDNNA